MSSDLLDNKSTSNRAKIADEIIKYLNETINCDNVLQFNKSNNNKYNLYCDIIQYLNEPDQDNICQNIYETMDFMTAANHTGFEFFPYIYGVLKCHLQEDNRIYIYRETFESNIIDLINNFTHPSEWYDLVFQIALIDFCINIVNEKYYFGDVEKFYYKKLPKPIYQEYILKGQTFKVNHKYLIVYWSVKSFCNEKKQEHISGIQSISNYINTNSGIKIQPSPRIIELLSRIIREPQKMDDVLLEYYMEK